MSEREDCARAFAEAIDPVVDEIREAVGLKQLRTRDWNPEAHIEITLTVAECRAIVAARRAALLVATAARRAKS